VSDSSVGDLAIVLHSHMPYVEGFGTYPFGEEWLFDAFARSHLPVLEVAERLTVTVTPVLADQLDAEGVGERMLTFLRRHRLAAAERDAAEGEEPLRAAASAEADHYRSAIERLEGHGGVALRAFQEAHAAGRVSLMASAASHAVLPKLATVAGRRLQVDAGLRSHRRRFAGEGGDRRPGGAEGFWLPECAYVPGLESLLAERGLGYTCLDGSALPCGAAPGRDGAPPDPVRLPGGLVAFAIDWPAVELVWSERGYPSDPAYLEYHRLSPNGIRLWSIEGRPYDPRAAERRAAEHARAFLAAVRGRLERHSAERGRRGLCVFAIDTELLGAWWAEGPPWLAGVIRAAEGERIRLLTLPEALAEHQAEERPATESSWGEGKTLETWDSPAVADLLWGARRLELRLLRELREQHLEPAAGERAARELLAVQSSDWAFMDHRGQAGDYPFDRAVGHAEALLEAIDSDATPEPRMRNLAPDLSLAPLLEP
jgi:1,4-alpha-glucan branching enzyme